ncbi:MAG: hypothetical protein ACSLFQ_10085 [Thermoanaerobaculia bacterium]
MRYVRKVMQILDQAIWIGVEFDEWSGIDPDELLGPGYLRVDHLSDEEIRETYQFEEFIHLGTSEDEVTDALEQIG